MTSNISGYRRAILLTAARDVIRRACDIRGHLPAGDPDRRFYLGVELAAREVLLPELSVSRHDDWLDLQPAEFREGYLRAVTVLSTALAAGDPPLRLRLPEPQELSA